MSANSPFPFHPRHQCGHVVRNCNRVVVKKVPSAQRNFYLDCPPHILRLVFANSSQKQLAAHFSAIKQLILSYQLVAHKRQALFKLLGYLRSLGGG